MLADMLDGRADTRPGLMFGFPAFYAAGKLVACVYGTGIAVRVSPEQASELRGQPSRAFEHARDYALAVDREDPWLALEVERQELRT